MGTKPLKLGYKGLEGVITRGFHGSHDPTRGGFQNLAGRVRRVELFNISRVCSVGLDWFGFTRVGAYRQIAFFFMSLNVNYGIISSDVPPRSIFG